MENQGLDFENQTGVEKVRSHPTPAVGNILRAKDRFHPSFQPSETQLYILYRLRAHDPVWHTLTDEDVALFNARWGKLAVTEGLQHLRETMPEDVNNPHGYLAATIRNLGEGK